MKLQYKYHFRPGYKSDKLLIEFFAGVEQAEFHTDFFEAIKDVHPEIISTDNLWMNDEISHTIKTDYGNVSLAQDIWDFCFITADDNQAALNQINKLLVADERFLKVEVDFDKYK